MREKFIPYERYYTKKQQKFWEEIGTTENKKAYKEYLKLRPPKWREEKDNWL